jgi:hypothetical protein
MPDAIVVPLRSKRQKKALAAQKLNHAIPALGLLFAGQQAMAAGGHGLDFYLGVFELVSAFVLLTLTARAIKGAVRPAHPERPPSHSASATARQAPTHHVHSVDWVDIAAGVVLVAEALEHWRLTHHVARPVLLSAIMTFALGLSHGRIAARAARRRILRVGDDGLFVGGRPFKVRHLDVRWPELRSIDVGERWAVITARSGRVRRLDLPDLEGETHVRAALATARQRLESHTAQ